MKTWLIAGGITIVLWAAEHLLCAKLKSPLWGGVIPLLTVAFTVWCFASGRMALDHTTFFPFFILNMLTFESWMEGRERRKKRQLAELEQMKAKDLGGPGL